MRKLSGCVVAICGLTACQPMMVEPNRTATPVVETSRTVIGPQISGRYVVVLQPGDWALNNLPLLPSEQCKAQADFADNANSLFQDQMAVHLRQLLHVVDVSPVRFSAADLVERGYVAQIVVHPESLSADERDLGEPIPFLSGPQSTPYEPGGGSRVVAAQSTVGVTLSVEVMGADGIAHTNLSNGSSGGDVLSAPNPPLRMQTGAEEQRVCEVLPGRLSREFQSALRDAIRKTSPILRTNLSFGR